MPLFLPAWLAVACLVHGSFDLSHASSAIKADPALDKIAKREDIAVDGSQLRSKYMAEPFLPIADSDVVLT